MQNRFENLTNWLLYGLLDYDFISESLLEDLDKKHIGMEEKSDHVTFNAGYMNYDAVIVPNCLTLRRHTLERLSEFAKRGGKVIFAGDAPSYIDAKKSIEGEKLAKDCIQIPFEKQEILSALSDFRSIDIQNANEMRTDRLLYQLREDNENKWLFIVQGEKAKEIDDVHADEVTITANGQLQVEEWDTLTGEKRTVKSIYSKKENKTKWNTIFYAQDSKLYYLKTGAECEKESSECEITKDNKPQEGTVLSLPDQIKVTKEEPNVLVLDMAEYRLDDGAWQQREEILRLDNKIREKLSYPKRADAYAQPWIYGERSFEHKVSLAYEIESEIALDEIELALEGIEHTEIIWNNKKIEKEITGYYVDLGIKKTKLPGLLKGKNHLEIQVLYHAGVNLEALYLLGDFSVNVYGKRTIISEPVKEIGFGDICSQGMPFYGGNLTYHIPVELSDESDLVIKAWKFKAPLLEVSLDQKEEQAIFLSPYTAKFKDVLQGKHELCIKMYGNRKNTFGQLHNCGENQLWCGPDSWRTQGAYWAYEYQLEKTGILHLDIECSK